MTHQDKISLLITFFVGMMVGAYIFVSGFATTFRLPEAGTKEQYANLVITGESFGHCETDASCLSFQILQDGSYQALIGSDEVVKSYKGTLSKRKLLTLTKVLSADNLEQTAKPKSDHTCHYGEDETNFRFLIALEGKNYSFDTCRSAIDYKGEVWISLVDAWREVAKASVK